MIKKYRFGTPFPTESIIAPIKQAEGMPQYGAVSLTDGFTFTYRMDSEDIIYGLGEANRGINKRGFLYTSNCSDNPHHQEDTLSFYGAHNFIIISGQVSFGIYVDYPSTLTFDIGFTHTDELIIRCHDANLDFYVLEGENAYDITKQFRKIIGRSYIPPRFAFGFGQSRWGYKTREDFHDVVKGYRENHIPIDMIYMDIDYMDSYKDFTVSDEFSDFPAFVNEIKKDNIRLIPIIDAGVKIEKGYEVYEEGVKHNYFCKRKDGSDFVAAVWPGYTHFPDVLNPEVRQWFGSKYQFLTEQGIEGFWNDMNEPAIFYTPEGIQRVKESIKHFLEQSETSDAVWDLQKNVSELANHPDDYGAFYHNVDGKKICHNQVHNLYGFNMTRAAGEALKKISPEKTVPALLPLLLHRHAPLWRHLDGR